MSDSALSVEDDIELAEGAPGGDSVDAREVFPVLQWRAQDVVIGLLPIALAVGLHWSLPTEMGRQIVIPLNVVALGWMWIYPSAIAKYRGARYEWPPLSVWAREAIVAAPTLLTIWCALLAVTAVAVWLFPQVNEYSNPFVEPAAGSLNNPLMLILLFVSACLIVPFFEELFFRGMLLQFLKQNMGLRSAILIQGLLFGFAHTYGVLHSILTSVLGIAFAIVYEWRKTIVAPICLHALQNSAAMLATIVMAQALASGPRLGVFGEPVIGGCKLVQVQPESSAAQAGLQKGDIIVEFGGAQITNFDSLKTAVRSHRVGEEVEVKFYRGDDPELQTTEVLLKKWTDSGKD